ncbi:hypothetical protein MNBD_GAMMA12-3117 [hydrothermal vent metagenome]|uniref:Sulphur oxidation protein SoxZ domain-containing protein n=1 Tax=hydrothermal vent metagenome TaxID=652676 RepID=A0A3B0Z437_9ZZZZ
MSTKTVKNSLRFRISKNKSGQLEFKSIVKHPMENGFRRDKTSGQLVPPDFIENFTVSIDGVECIDLQLSANVSKNPFFLFDFTKPVIDGQLVNVTWVDNRGAIVSYDSTIAFDNKHAHNFTGQYTP